MKEQVELSNSIAMDVKPNELTRTGNIVVIESEINATSTKDGKHIGQFRLLIEAEPVSIVCLTEILVTQIRDVIKAYSDHVKNFY